MEDEEIKEVFSRNLKAIRKNNKMIQEELAEKSNISAQFLRDIEAKRKIGSINTLINICLALEITPDELFYELFDENIDENKKLISKINMLSKNNKNILNTIINQMLEDKSS